MQSDHYLRASSPKGIDERKLRRGGERQCFEGGAAARQDGVQPDQVGSLQPGQEKNDENY